MVAYKAKYSVIRHDTIGLYYLLCEATLPYNRFKCTLQTFKMPNISDVNLLMITNQINKKDLIKIMRTKFHAKQLKYQSNILYFRQEKYAMEAKDYLETLNLMYHLLPEGS